MPRKTQQRQNRERVQEKDSTQRAGRAPSRPKQQRRSPFRAWIASPTVQWTGLVALVVAVIVGLVALGVSTSAADDFEFTMYQGEDALPIDGELTYPKIFPAQKPVVLNFWAGLCPVCRVGMPHFQAVYDEMGEDFIFVGLDIGPLVGLGNQRDAENLLRQLNITYPVGRVHNRDALTKFRVTGTPTTVFLTPDGKVFRSWPGFLDQRDMARMIQDLLKAGGVASS